MKNPRDKNPDISFTDNTLDGAAYRKYCAHVDCDIENMARDPEAEKMTAEWDSQGVDNDEIIERLKAYYTVKAQSNEPSLAAE